MLRTNSTILDGWRPTSLPEKVLRKELDDHTWGWNVEAAMDRIQSRSISECWVCCLLLHCGARSTHDSLFKCNGNMRKKLRGSCRSLVRFWFCRGSCGFLVHCWPCRVPRTTLAGVSLTWRSPHFRWLGPISRLILQEIRFWSSAKIIFWPRSSRSWISLLIVKEVTIVGRRKSASKK